jgi:hypothetical protein
MRIAFHRWQGRGRAMLALACAAASLVLAAPSARATVYKCKTGNNGVVYQEFPCPIGKELRNFDEDPPDLSIIHGGVALPAAPPAERPKESRTIQGDTTAGKASGNAGARKFVEKGMSEAEVLARIGRPDATAGGSKMQQTRWSYLPADGDPDTVTTITFSSGAVSDVSRKVLKR